MRTAEIIDAVLRMRVTDAALLPLLSARTRGVKYIRKAEIATAAPLQKNKNIKAESKIHIVGNDGANLKSVYPHWLPLLQSWLTVGCEIRYLLLEMEDSIFQALHRLRKDNLGSGKLRVYTINNDRPLPKEVRDLVQRWRTFHFAIFENPRQLWIEMNHQPQKTHADNCYFIPTKLAEKPGILDVYKSQFDFVISRAGKLVYEIPLQQKAVGPRRLVRTRGPLLSERM